jgi:hypothetical protein
MIISEIAFVIAKFNGLGSSVQRWKQNGKKYR